MTTEMAQPRKTGNAYNIFILVLTLLIDFLLNLRAAPKKSDYFLRQGGWLDLIGSLPSLGITQRSSNRSALS